MDNTPSKQAFHQTINFGKLLWLLPLFLFSCASHPEFIYLQNLDMKTQMELNSIENQVVIKIQPFDFLYISVYSIDPLAAVPFNPQVAAGAAGNAQPEVIGYKVGEDGFIDFPVVGAKRVVGLTLREAEAVLTKEVEKYLKEPVISIKFLNLKVTVIGEVNRPSTFDIPVENMSILQAIGLAGDVSIYGDRNNILVVREQNGIRTFGKLSLLNADIFNSPFYYLQQNDVVYVQPSEVKDTQINALSSREILPWVSAGVSLASLLIIALR